MKLHYYVITAVVTATFLFSCTGKNGSDGTKEAQDSTSVDTITTVDETPVETVDEMDPKVSAFIEDMYNAGRYTDYEFLEKHCTKRLLQKLRDDYDYDGEGYAVWNFRTSCQDGMLDTEEHMNRVVSVEYQGNGWYAYEFYDSGWNGKNKIKASVVDDKVMMDDIETLYDECADKYRSESAEY